MNATRKESRAIRQQMDHIRCRLPYSMDDARAEARQLADWRYYVGRFPMATLGVAAAVGYIAVPQRKQVVSPDEATLRKLAKKNRLVVRNQQEAEPKRGSPASFMFNMAANMLLRAGIAFIGQRLGKVMGVNVVGEQAR